MGSRKRLRLTSSALAALLSLLFVQSDAQGSVDDEHALKMGDDTVTGDTSIPFEGYRLDPDFGDPPVSECKSEAEDLQRWGPGSISGASKYSCYGTTLAHDSAGAIHKFRARVCRNGPAPMNARFKARAAAFRIMDAAMLGFKKAHGEPGPLVVDRQTVKCTHLPDDAGAPAPEEVRPPLAEHPNAAHLTIHSKDRYRLTARFFSQSSGNHYTGPDAPNGNYTIGTTLSESFTCTSGERVCFGAWREGQDVSWGVGRLNDQSCQNCCAVCGGDLETTIGDAGPDRGPPPTVFIMHNKDRYALGLEFFTRSGASGTWPGNNRHFVLAGDHTYKLTCQAGQQICYGAYRDGQSKYWGVGHNDQGCENCCVMCGGVAEKTLLDGGSDSPSGGGGGSPSVAGVGAAVGVAAGLLNAFGGGAMRGGGGMHYGGGHAYGPGPRPPSSGISGTR